MAFAGVIRDLWLFVVFRRGVRAVLLCIISPAGGCLTALRGFARGIYRAEAGRAVKGRSGAVKGNKKPAVIRRV
jgi:hypothetical protein